jgi:pantoate--beta-alanine ligase
MGFLHEGHLSLMRRAVAENDLCVVSIFVNPTQFGPNEDLDRYPRDPEGDAEKCRSVGASAIFTPEASEIYEPGFQTYVEVGDIANHLCGESRPGHFRGVATVCLKLFNIVAPTKAYFGLKDYQQVQVVSTMARDLDLDPEIVPCDIIRETDGLAMSSRNAYLSEDQRQQATGLHDALIRARKLYEAGERNPQVFIAKMRERITEEPDAMIDYVSLVHPETLEDLTEIQDGVVAALAVKIGATRLIDNMRLDRPAHT